MVDQTFLDVGVNWLGKGYFARPFSAADLSKLSERERDPWLAWQERFIEAKRGRFGRIAELIDIYERAGNWLLIGACSDLLGDAGDAACLQGMAARIEECKDPIVALMMRINFSVAFGVAGALALVPVIVDTYQKHHTFGDADIIPYVLSNMLEPELEAFCEPAEYASLDDYCAAVLDRHVELGEQLGPHATVFRGEQYSVRRVAQAVLDEVAKGQLDPGLRQQFEASTGIETANFFKGGRLQPLTAAAIVEGFLASPSAANYVDGARYFFGHRIP